MRCQKNFCNQIKNARKKDQVVHIAYNEKVYNVRVLRFTLASGEEEILITNLLDKKLSIKYFKSLYFMRWGLKYEYKPNINLLIGTLKDKFILMLLEKSSRKRSKHYKEIMEQVSKSSVPIRSNRQYPRKKFLVRTNYPLNKKRCL